MRKRGLDVTEIDYAKKPLDEAAVRAIVAAAGSVAAVLNTRHATVKAKGWVDKPPAADAFVEAVLAEPNVLRRPILLTGRRAIIGFDEAAYSKL